MKRIVIFLCIFWMGLIFYMSSTNGEISHQESTKIVGLIKETKTQINDANAVKQQQVEINKLDFLIRKNAHAFLYMILAVLVSSVFLTLKKRGKNAIVNVLFICLFYAVTDEFHQSFIQGRTSLINDVLIDFGGALLGTAIFYLAYYKVYKTKIKERNIIRRNKKNNKSMCLNK